MKHTPGPWLIRKGDEWTHDIVTIDGEMPDGTPSYWNVASANHLRDEVKANVRLIAAAPDLLAALEALCRQMEFDDREPLGWESFKAARAAIAKATREAA